MTYLSKQIDNSSIGIKISPYIFCCYWTSHFKKFFFNLRNLTANVSAIQKGHYNSFPYRVVDPNIDPTPRDVYFKKDSASYDIVSGNPLILTLNLNHGYEYFVDILCADHVKISDISLIQESNNTNINIEKFLGTYDTTVSSSNQFETYAYAKFKILKKSSQNLNHLLKITADSTIGKTPSTAETDLFDIPNVRILIYGVPI